MNQSRSSSRVILIGITAVLALAVGVDQTGWLQRSHESGAELVRGRYLQRAALLADQSQLLESADQWRDAAGSSRDLWTDLERRLVVAPSIELAGARFRDLIVDELRTLGIDLPRVTLLEQSADEAVAASVHTISLEVRFDVSHHQNVYAALDRLEHLENRMTTIASLSIDGPGRIQMPRRVSVTLEVQALALIQSNPDKASDEEIGP